MMLHRDSYWVRYMLRLWRYRFVKILPLMLGFFSLLWFLIRVIPKPSRVTYPCQRAAFPLASAFVIWLTGLVGSMVVFRRAKQLFRKTQPAVAVLALAAAASAAFISLYHMPDPPLRADLPVPANQPIGQAVGVNPGRVTWVHDPDATSWGGVGDGFWWETSKNNQNRINQMMGDAVRWLAGTSTEAQAWDTIFRNFNISHHQQDQSYTSGEKITIKVNFVGCINIAGWGGCNPDTYDLEPGSPDFQNYPNTSPQIIVALIRQLVDVVGVQQQNIWIGDTTCLFPNQYYDICTAYYPNVNYFDCLGGIPGHPRTSVSSSSTRVYWSTNPGGNPDYLPQCYVDAAYIINMANLKTHEYNAGITACGKNHYGSLIRTPGQSGFFDLHPDLPADRSGMGHYRPMVDLWGHDHLGGKTILNILDALYAGRHTSATYVPQKWNLSPFNNDWVSSVFVSQDQVAIDSVAFDFLLAEYSGLSLGPARSGTEDYLHEAALANNPPSGIFYDPNHSGNVQRIGSLGVHEHWNNNSSKQYTRNLDPINGQGIELISSEPIIEQPPDAPHSLDAVYITDSRVDLTWIDNSDDEDGFMIERKVEYGSYSAIADVDANDTSYSDTGLALGQTYTYRMYAYNAAGNSDYSNEASPYYPLPDAPTGLSTIAGNARVEIMWTCNTEPNVLYYKLHKSTTSGTGHEVVAIIFGDCSVIDCNVYNDTTYYYRLSAVNTFGQESDPSGEVSALPQIAAPRPPTNLNAFPSDGQVDLVWNPNTEPDLSYYQLYRSLALTGTYQPVTVIYEAQQVTDLNVVNGTTYYYKVTAVNSSEQESGFSSPPVYATPQFGDVPNPPSNLTALSNAIRQIALDWQDNSDNELGFKLERNAGTGFQLIATLDPNITSYTDTGLTGSMLYQYRVCSYAGTGSSAYSNTASETALSEFINVDDADPAAIYTGSWTARTGLTGRTNGTTHESNDSNATVEFTFTGIGIQLVAETQTWGGSAELYIDDIYYGTISFYSDLGQQFQQLIYSKQDLTFSEHTIRIEAGDSDWIYVDEFIYSVP